MHVRRVPVRVLGAWHWLGAVHDNTVTFARCVPNCDACSVTDTDDRRDDRYNGDDARADNDGDDHNNDHNDDYGADDAFSDDGHDGHDHNNGDVGTAILLPSQR